MKPDLIQAISTSTGYVVSFMFLVYIGIFDTDSVAQSLLCTGIVADSFTVTDIMVLLSFLIFCVTVTLSSVSDADADTDAVLIQMLVSIVFCGCVLLEPWG